MTGDVNECADAVLEAQENGRNRVWTCNTTLGARRTSCQLLSFASSSPAWRSPM